MEIPIISKFNKLKSNTWSLFPLYRVAFFLDFGAKSSEGKLPILPVYRSNLLNAPWRKSDPTTETQADEGCRLRMVNEGTRDSAEMDASQGTLTNCPDTDWRTQHRHFPSETRGSLNSISYCAKSIYPYISSLQI